MGVLLGSINLVLTDESVCFSHVNVYRETQRGLSDMATYFHTSWLNMVSGDDKWFVESALGQHALHQVMTNPYWSMRRYQLTALPLHSACRKEKTVRRKHAALWVVTFSPLYVSTSSACTGISFPILIHQWCSVKISPNHRGHAVIREWVVVIVVAWSQGSGRM